MFDGIDFPRQPPSRRPVNEKALAIVVFVVALLMLVMPISLNAMADIFRYVRGH